MPDPTLPLIRWLADEARALKDPGRLCAAVCHQLVLAGVPLTRSSWALQGADARTLGQGLTWKAGHEVARRSFASDELLADRFQQSPLRAIFFGGAPVRRRLCDPSTPRDFPILDELAAEGITDYLALPMRFLDGRAHATTWATDAPAGFTALHVRVIADVNRVLPLLLELWEARSR